MTEITPNILKICLFFTYISFGFSSTCNNPEVSAVSFTTQDATIVTHIAFVAEFSLKCGDGSVPNLYADINSNVVPVAIIGEQKYQISWTEDIKSARSGDRSVRLYDEEGYTVYRKTVRSGEATTDVPSLVTIIVSYPGSFQGPWLKSEFMAAALSVLVVYIAFSSRSKLLS